MLFDPRREKYPTLYRFIAWLRTKPADEFYDWSSPKACACGQFGWFEAFKARDEGVDLNGIAAGDDWDRGLLRPADWTFGQCLARAERKLEELTHV
jgi:hypothetical protein